MGRFPFPAAPAGWFHVADSDDVQPGRVVPLQYFGRDLVCYRGHDGDIRVFDAFCPHLGAHIGYGGEVDDDQLVCPFHGWKFAPDGRNTEIPYSSRPSRKARLASWPVTEANGGVYAWFDPDGAPPSWDVPHLPECTADGYLLHIGDRWRMRTHVQEVMENTVDAAHFRFVHRTAGFGATDVLEDGPMLRATAAVTFVTPRGDVDGAVISELWGLGIDVVRPQGIVDAAAVFWATPVDDEIIEAGYTFFVPKDPDGDGMTSVAQGLVADFHQQATQDMPIWEHKAYQQTPALAPDDGPIMRYRRWARQFYGAGGSAS